MALPLMLGICLVAGVACFLTDRATKAANKFTHHGDDINNRPPAPATFSNNLNRGPPAAPATSSNNLNRGPPAAPDTSSNNLNRGPPAAPATSSNNLNRGPPAAPATSSNNLNRGPPAAPDTSSNNLNRRPRATATSSDNDLNGCSPAAPATSPDNLNRLLPAPATLSDNPNPRPRAPATLSNSPVMYVGDMATELAKYEVCPLVHSTDAVRPVEVHLQTNMVEEVKINELSNGLAEGLEYNDVFKGSLGDGLGAVTSVVELELDDNIDVITPLTEKADVLKLEEEVVNLCGGVIGSREGWWVAVKKWVEERFRWLKDKLKLWAEWPMLDPDVDMRRTLRRLVWVVMDSMVESKYGIGHYRVLLKMYRILTNEIRCR